MRSARSDHVDAGLASPRVASVPNVVVVLFNVSLLILIIRQR